MDSAKEFKDNKCNSENLTEILNYQKMTTLSMKERHQFLYQKTEECANELPSKLSPTDKSEYAIINSNNPYEIEFSDTDAGAYSDYNNGCVRANCPIPISIELYYFEIKVLSTGSKGHIYIGLTTSGTDLSRAPGWDRGTYGYHGDDGKKFAAQSLGTPYGPIFRQNDVIGCCVNFGNQSCFYTINGKSLGIAFKNIPLNPLFPTVGVGSKNEKVEVNFGQSPFVYDIKLEMILNESLLKDLSIKGTSTESKSKEKNAHEPSQRFESLFI